MSEQQHQLVYCTCPSIEVADSIARQLVEKQLAACVNIIRNIKSVYRWQGKIESDTESLLLIKTQASMMTDLQACILACHPYELPEIIAVPIVSGLPDYLKWITSSTEQNK
jgi:periplasmic divalent cation tolerance protein